MRISLISIFMIIQISHVVGQVNLVGENLKFTNKRDNSIIYFTSSKGNGFYGFHYLHKEKDSVKECYLNLPKDSLPHFIDSLINNGYRQINSRRKNKDIEKKTAEFKNAEVALNSYLFNNINCYKDSVFKFDLSIKLKYKNGKLKTVNSGYIKTISARDDIGKNINKTEFTFIEYQYIGTEIKFICFNIRNIAQQAPIIVDCDKKQEVDNMCCTIIYY